MKNKVIYSILLTKKRYLINIVYMRILLIQISRLGDIIQSLPLINDLKGLYPQSLISILINDVFSETVCLLNDIDVIPIIFENFVHSINGEFTISKNNYFVDEIGLLNQKGFDLVINLNNSPIAKEILNNINCDEKIGFGSCDNDSEAWSAYVTSFMKSRHLNSVNLVDIFRGLLIGKCLTTETQRFHREHRVQGLGSYVLPSVNLSGECSACLTSFGSENVGNEGNEKLDKVQGAWIGEQGLVGRGKPHSYNVAIQCGARNIKRQFTLTHYTDIASHYLSKGYKVYLLGTKEESRTALSIKQKINNDDLIDMTGKTSLKQLREIISSCEKIYTPDTGTMHLSGYCNTPFVALFYGPAYPPETLAYTSKAEVYMPDKKYFPCYPCDDEKECNNGFNCHKFSFKDLFEGKVQNEFVKLSIGYDEIGQILSPLNQEAILWREFTKHYFYNSSSCRDAACHILQGRSEGNSGCDTPISEQTKTKLNRELKLWDVLDSNDLEIACENLHILKPLIFLNKMGFKGIVEEAIAFFKEKI